MVFRTGVIWLRTCRMNARLASGRCRMPRALHLVHNYAPNESNKVHLPTVILSTATRSLDQTPRRGGLVRGQVHQRATNTKGSTTSSTQMDWNHLITAQGSTWRLEGDVVKGQKWPPRTHLRNGRDWLELPRLAILKLRQWLGAILYIICVLIMGVGMGDMKALCRGRCHKWFHLPSPTPTYLGPFVINFCGDYVPQYSENWYL